MKMTYYAKQFVIPAKAGIQSGQQITHFSIPGFPLLPPSRSENPRRVESEGMTRAED